MNGTRNMKLSNYVKSIVNSHPNHSTGQLIHRIKYFDVVSFDVFDTLIKRNVYKSEDILDLAVYNYCNYLNITGYSEIKKRRVQAEKDARLKTTDEITLSDIQNNLHNITNSSLLLDCEMEAERKLCFPNPKIKPVYDWCVKNNKKIIIVSDIYYSKEFIRKLLELNGYYNYDDLFISSEYGLSKRSGKLYDVIKKRYAKQSTIIHIGDDLRADYLNSWFKHISAIKIARNPKSEIIVNTKHLNPHYKNTWNRLNRIIDGHTTDRMGYFFKYGYVVLGPLMYSMAFWLQDAAKKDNIEKLYFISRDGYLMQCVYNKLFEKDSVTNYYMYASRASTRFPYLYLHSDIKDFVSQFHGRAYTCVSWQDFSNMINIDDEIVRNEWLKAGLSEQETINIYNKNEKFELLYNSIYDNIISQCKEQYNNFLQYLHELDFNGKVGIVDIGWYGSLQKTLNEIIHNVKSDASINGYYLGLRGNQDKSYHSFVPPNDNPGDFVCNFVEFPFMTFEGSTKRYTNENGNVKPILSDYEYKGLSKEQEALKELHDGTLKFIDDFKSINFSITPDVAYQGLKCASKYPTLKLARKFGDMFYKEDQMRYLAKPKSILFYIFHPKSFKTDFIKSSWKTGFIKRLLKFDFNYYGLICYISKRKI